MVNGTLRYATAAQEREEDAYGVRGRGRAAKRGPTFRPTLPVKARTSERAEPPPCNVRYARSFARVNLSGLAARPSAHFPGRKTKEPSDELSEHPQAHRHHRP